MPPELALGSTSSDCGQQSRVVSRSVVTLVDQGTPTLAAFHTHLLLEFGRAVTCTSDEQDLLTIAAQTMANALGTELVAVLLREGPNQLRAACAVDCCLGEVFSTPLSCTCDSLAGAVVTAGLPIVVTDYSREARFSLTDCERKAGVTNSMAVPLLGREHVLGVLVAHSRGRSHFDLHALRFLESLANLLGMGLRAVRAEQGLGHAQRLASVGQLTAGVIHDFNNMLGLVQGNLRALEERLVRVGDSKGQQFAAAATSAAARSATLARKLLVLSRRGSVPQLTVEVTTMLRSLSQLLRATLGNGIRVELQVPCVEVLVIAEPAGLESALLSVSLNARDAMRSGGVLSLKVVPDAQLPLELQGEVAEPEARFVAITVSDTGTGMPPQVLERAFEPFFTTKSPVCGTGLGLSSLRQFAKDSKGAVALHSTPGEGTRLTVYLPGPPAATTADAT
jgi:signal transduction histidine kinase